MVMVTLHGPNSSCIKRATWYQNYYGNNTNDKITHIIGPWGGSRDIYLEKMTVCNGSYICYFMIGCIALMVPVPSCRFVHDAIGSSGVTMSNFMVIESGHGM